jgi:hypothetical protein
MWLAASACSLWCETVEDLPGWSSPELRRALAVAVLEHVAAAVDAGTLAVPDCKHAVVLRARQQWRLLGAPDRSRREVFVYAGPENDVRRLETFGLAPQFHVVHAERGAAVAGDEARGVAAQRLVDRSLQQRQAHQHLRAAHQDPPGDEVVLVVEGDAGQRGGGHVHAPRTGSPGAGS